jgi:hypothetical protein
MELTTAWGRRPWEGLRRAGAGYGLGATKGAARSERAGKYAGRGSRDYGRELKTSSTGNRNAVQRELCELGSGAGGGKGEMEGEGSKGRAQERATAWRLALGVKITIQEPSDGQALVHHSIAVQQWRRNIPERDENGWIFHRLERQKIERKKLTRAKENQPTVATQKSNRGRRCARKKNQAAAGKIWARLKKIKPADTNWSWVVVGIKIQRAVRGRD